MNSLDFKVFIEVNKVLHSLKDENEPMITDVYVPLMPEQQKSWRGFNRCCFFWRAMDCYAYHHLLFHLKIKADLSQ